MEVRGKTRINKTRFEKGTNRADTMKYKGLLEVTKHLDKLGTK